MYPALRGDHGLKLACTMITTYVCDMNGLILQNDEYIILYKSNVKIDGLCKTSASLVASVERHVLSELNDGILCCADVSGRSC